MSKVNCECVDNGFCSCHASEGTCGDWILTGLLILSVYTGFLALADWLYK